MDEGHLRGAFRDAGMEILELRPATSDEVVATGSSWAKRLGAGRTRPATLLLAVRR